MIRSICGRRVLVVDAEPDITTTLSLLLNQLGYDTRCAHRGRQALQLAREFDPDLILIDTGLPDVSGYELARALRGKPGLARRYIAALMARGQADSGERAMRAGFDQWLAKPIDIAKLRAILRCVGDRLAHAAVN